MSDKPTRKWFQIHLLTAIVMMFVAGGLLGLNLRPMPYGMYQEPYKHLDGTDFGWPCLASQIPPKYVYSSLPPVDTVILNWKWDGVAKNLAVTLIILGVVAFLCEWFIRRREAAREREKA